MLRRFVCVAVCAVVLCGTIKVVGQQDDSDSISKKVNRGLEQAESKLRQTWGDIKRATHRMSIEGRVYARLYWDKSLTDATWKLEARNGGVIVLKGSVPTSEAKRRAVELAQTTVGVNETVDELGVAANKEKKD